MEEDLNSADSFRNFDFNYFGENDFSMLNCINADILSLSESSECAMND